jgi:transposase
LVKSAFSQESLALDPLREHRAILLVHDHAEVSLSVRAAGWSRCRPLHVCYEAGPCGYVLYLQRAKLGVRCDVVAPTLIPVKAGDRVKTDRRDAEKLARSLRAGDLTAVWVPDAEHEALRDLVRAREAAKGDQRRARQRLLKFLLRRGSFPPGTMRAWTDKHREWILKLTFELRALEETLTDYAAEVDHQSARLARLEHAIDEAVDKVPASMRAVIDALQALRGVSKLTATTLVAEVGELSRFERAGQLMGYSGAVPSEHSSGGKTRRGGITKTGNSYPPQPCPRCRMSTRTSP